MSAGFDLSGVNARNELGERDLRVYSQAEETDAAVEKTLNDTWRSKATLRVVRGLLFRKGFSSGLRSYK